MDKGSFYGTAETGVPERRIGRRCLQAAVAVAAIAIFATGGINPANLDSVMEKLSPIKGPGE